MGYSEGLEMVMKDVREQLTRIEEMLAAIQPCDGEKDGIRCALGPHVGWHASEDGKQQWMDD